jgi:membrane associated rhomboid family serine protease
MGIPERCKELAPAAMLSGVVFGVVGWACLAAPRLSERGAAITAMLRQRPELAAALVIGLVVAPLWPRLGYPPSAP